MRLHQERIDNVKASFEKLIPEVGESFRCFDRSHLKTSIKWHRHPEIEINFVEFGRGTRIVGDSIGTYGNGDLVLLGGNLPHTWMSDDFIGKKYDRHPSVVIQFLPMIFGELLSLPEMESIQRLLKRSQRGLKFGPKITTRVGTQMTAMLKMKGADRLICLLRCLQWMANSSSAQTLASRSFHLIENDLSDARIQTVCQFVSTNLTDPNLNHESILELVKMNPSAFSRFFKQATGRTLTRYINELRIGLACRKLADPQEKVIEICYSVGFRNLSNFNRRFKELRNMTPREFRRQMLNG